MFIKDIFESGIFPIKIFHMKIYILGQLYPLVIISSVSLPSALSEDSSSFPEGSLFKNCVTLKNRSKRGKNKATDIMTTICSSDGGKNIIQLVTHHESVT